MRIVFIIPVLAAILANPAGAQSSWQEYAYPQQQFAVSFPGQPVIQILPIKTADGSRVTETLYTVRQETRLFQVVVIDFGNAEIDGPTIMARSINAAQRWGDVKLDIPARVQRTFGRYLNIAGHDGSHSVAAVFFAENRLYEIEGTVAASNPDALSGDMIRFQQSLRFMGRAAGRSYAPVYMPDLLQVGDRFFGPSRLR
jgi:hypothetical protein